MTEAFCWIG